MKSNMNQSYQSPSQDHRHAEPAAHGIAAATTNSRYTCPMHPEIVRDAPGSCPKCGMTLVPVVAASHRCAERSRARGHKRVAIQWRHMVSLAQRPAKDAFCPMPYKRHSCQPIPTAASVRG